jgi:hypothetical protein
MYRMRLRQSERLPYRLARSLLWGALLTLLIVAVAYAITARG